MIIYLRNAKNEDLADIEILTDSEGNPDVRAYIPIKAYSDFLVYTCRTQGSPGDIVADFAMLDDLRGWYWERFLPQYDPTGKKLVHPPLGVTIHSIIEILTLIAKKYNLTIVTD